jgi:hypothetical protein
MAAPSRPCTHWQLTADNPYLKGDGDEQHA